MASRKSRRGKFPWAMLWCVAFACVTGLGIVTSALTRPIFVTVLGAKKSDESRIESIMRSYATKPALMINALEVQKQIESNPRVFESEFSANLFGRATLNVRYRMPVAALEGTKLWTDDTGALFPSDGTVSPNLTIAKNVQVFRPILSLCDPAPFRWAIELSKNLQVKAKNLPGRVALDASGRLCLEAGDLLVVFGDADKLPAKVSYLVKVLKQHPDWLQGRVINLVDIEHPMQSQRR